MNQLRTPIQWYFPVFPFCVSFDIINHGDHRGNTAQALAQWQHLVASSETLDVLHWGMCPVLHHWIPMAIKIASDFPVFVCIDSFVVAHGHS
jgi:hypothetical protein